MDLCNILSFFPFNVVNTLTTNTNIIMNEIGLIAYKIHFQSLIKESWNIFFTP